MGLERWWGGGCAFPRVYSSLRVAWLDSTYLWLRTNKRQVVLPRAHPLLEPPLYVLGEEHPVQLLLDLAAALT